MESFMIPESELYKDKHINLMQEYILDNKINYHKFRSFFISRTYQTKAEIEKWSEFFDIIAVGFKPKKSSQKKIVRQILFKKLKEYSNEKRSSIFDKIDKNKSITCIEQTTKDYEEQLQKAKKEISLLQNTCDLQKSQIEKLKLEKEEEKKSTEIKISTYLSIIQNIKK